MALHIGNDRIVITIPRTGFALKFPRIRFALAVKLVAREWRRSDRWGRLAQAWSYPIEVRYGLRHLLFSGLRANWHERKFYRRTRHPFAQPTYLSVFGVINVQRASVVMYEADFISLSRQMDSLTGGESVNDAHHFGNSRNFGVHGGRLVMHDYGSPATQILIDRYGEKIWKEYVL